MQNLHLSFLAESLGLPSIDNAAHGTKGILLKTKVSNLLI